MNPMEVIRYLHPEAVPQVDYDTYDGSEFACWRLPGNPPTFDELRAVSESTEYKEWEYRQECSVIDAKTGHAIDRAVHPRCGTQEQLGVLRDQIVQILNTHGLEPTADFALLNEIALQAIAEGQAKKEVL